jgi:hypothetical protein
MKLMTDSAAWVRSPMTPRTTILACAGDEIKKNRRNAIPVQVRIFFMFTVTHPVRNTR